MLTPAKNSVHFFVGDAMDANLAVFKTSRLELLADLSPHERSVLATVVSELAHNIVKYAHRGSLRLTRLDEAGRSGVEIVAEDRGPGIPDVAAALRDHYSTGGTLGLGLPGIRRMMDEFEVESGPGRGTRITTSKWLRRRGEL